LSFNNGCNRFFSYVVFTENRRFMGGHQRLPRVPEKWLAISPGPKQKTGSFYSLQHSKVNFCAFEKSSCSNNYSRAFPGVKRLIPVSAPDVAYSLTKSLSLCNVSGRTLHCILCIEQYNLGKKKRALSLTYQEIEEQYIFKKTNKTK
jgi:hypothetical protein